jgi:hypothetical protein
MQALRRYCQAKDVPDMQNEARKRLLRLPYRKGPRIRVPQGRSGSVAEKSKDKKTASGTRQGDKRSCPGRQVQGAGICYAEQAAVDGWRNAEHPKGTAGSYRQNMCLVVGEPRINTNEHEWLRDGYGI